MLYFPTVSCIAFEGKDSRNPLSFHHYNPDEVIAGKTMAEHLRFAVCYWHTFRGTGADPFGGPVYLRPWDKATTPVQKAEKAIDAAFEFFEKLGVGYWCFHDRDIAPEGQTLAETNETLDHIISIAERKQNESGMKLLWGTANLFSNRRYIAGAGTNPDPRIFAYAAAQVKKAIEVTHRLGGEGYVFWGGREGYDTLLNTDLGRETDNLARLLQLAVDFKKSIGFTGAFYIEPKPQEPTKHQYDYDSQSCHAFLLKHGLEKEFLLNIEANHATLAGHEFQHELEYAASNGLLGSVDANRGDLLCGWDTDQFPTDIRETTLAMRTILGAGGFKTGGLNFDAKVRRQSIDGEDLFHAHIGAMDAFAVGFKAAIAIKEDGRLDELLASRYEGWKSELGQAIEAGTSLQELENIALAEPEPQPVSGRQELLENVLNQAIESVLR